MRFATLCSVAVLVLSAATLAPAAHADEELVSFDTCSEVVDFAEGGAGLDSWPAWSESEEASMTLRRSTPEPVEVEESSGTGYDDPQSVVAEEDSASAAPSEAKAGGDSAEDVSGTNTQEEGIDEPDLFKTDARLLFLLAGSELRVVTARTDVPRAIARLPLEIADAQLLKSGDKLLVLGYVPGGKRQDDDGAIVRDARYPRTTRLIEVDISDRTAPRVLRTMDAPGQIIAARQTGSTVRLVVNTLVDEGYEYEEDEDGYVDDEEYDDVELDLDEVIPSTSLKSAVTGDRYQRRMAPCDQVDRPAGFSGNDLVSIFTFDLARGLIGIRREALMANAQVVYASPTTLYIASGRYKDWGFEQGLPEDTYTDIHAFDLTTPNQTNYAGTGRVLGIPLNKYAFSEFGGDLRVATTTEPGWVKIDLAEELQAQCDAEDEDDYDGEYSDECEEDYKEPTIPVDNRVTVLRRAGNDLTQVGLVDGIGRGGTIDAVRFDGPRGYVATSAYEEIKNAPLTVLDLEDPAVPKAVGVLRIPGYSAYLHPLGDGLVLGVGQDVAEGDNDDDWVGGVVSLFDVSEPASPKRLAKRNLGRGYAGAQYDPHAFLWWPSKKLVLLPYTQWLDVDEAWDLWGWEGRGELIGLTATRGGGSNLKEISRITHGPAWDNPGVVRGVVFGDRLLSISELGVGTSKVSDLSPLGYLPYLPYAQDLAPAKRCAVPGTTPIGTTPVGTTPAGTTPSSTTPGTTPSTTPSATTPKAARAQAGTTPAGTTPSATTPGTTPSGTTPPTPTPLPAIPWAAPWQADRCPTPVPTVAPTTPAGTTPASTTPGTTPGTTPTIGTPAPTTPGTQP